ncbi:Glycine betaine transport system permease protein OpuAB [Nocardioides dokdonensis FR1436]|uniref:Glycine betaine transport system permease protein OpuAB n=1 Tax=Nocardioides dokdonensis FR1436 TaxID=1300347 RepID=A0A1A9GMY8_9ACTN|nr:ABC transporter permease subunit [Nocardioides dokdonensis]ANH39032.1 Glycine betaine transport system permease protein OpuAB [Nocardioides dokdonensis FR1436]
MSTQAASSTSDPIVPRIPVGEWIDSGFDWVKENLGEFFDTVSDGTETVIGGLSDALNSPAPLLMVGILSVVALLVAGWKVALTSLVGLTLVIGMDQWENAMVTLALVLTATVVALLIGIPVGVLAATSDRVSRAVRPVLDLMQTMPAFVWLVPVVTLFSIGVPAGLVATVIFAVPPGVRLTELGIRQVDAEVVEAGNAFGGTRRQILGGIQLPLALPTVMAGVNQVIMLSLSMAVIAGLVGAGGLGGAVTSSIARLDIGLGFEAGLAVVALAIYLDRVTAAVSERGRRSRPSLRGLVARREQRRAVRSAA